MSTEIVSVIGAISGILAFAGIIYGFGVKFSRLETKVSLIWGVFVEDALRKHTKGRCVNFGYYQRNGIFYSG